MRIQEFGTSCCFWVTASLAFRTWSIQVVTTKILGARPFPIECPVFGSNMNLYEGKCMLSLIMHFKGNTQCLLNLKKTNICTIEPLQNIKLISIVH